MTENITNTTSTSNTSLPLLNQNFLAVVPSNRSPQIGQLVKALAEAQKKFTPIKKTIENTYYGSKYADLSDIIAATQPALAENSLIVSQLPIFDNTAREAGVQTILAHSSGEFISSELKLPSTGLGKDSRIKFDAQTIGIAITYARRYGYQAIVGVASEIDDDANAISEPGSSNPTPQRGRPPLQRGPKGTTYVPKPSPESIKSNYPETGKVPVPSAEIPTYKAIDDDLPPSMFDKNGLPNVTFKSPFEEVFPTKEESQVFIKKIRGYIKQLEGKIEDPSKAMQAFFLRNTGKSESKNLTRAEINSIITELTTKDADLVKIVLGQSKESLKGASA